MTLCCELSRADASVCWAKEGVRLEAGGSLVLEERVPIAGCSSLLPKLSTLENTPVTLPMTQ